MRRILTVLILAGFMSQSAFAGGVASKVACATVLANPLGLQCMALVKVAKNSGVLTSQEHCLEQTRTVAGITTFLTGDAGLSALMSGIFVKCACRAIF